MGGEEGPTKPDPRPLEACATIGKAACCDHPESASQVDLEVSLKDTEGPDQKVTLQAWLAGRAPLVATSHERDCRVRVAL
jgi:hypothetical protein